ncbi:histidine kinase [Desulfurobacterium thermolithotrophum DSM 11699]|uniref:Histidine kinase n=1 Tax=Desulfurobacterium thermolithotrophum (strain DSM 11699 / BSA) TaxID=868864 RepID=F0S1B4_DESTD|nr:hypothetical protein [Desulfurobacterium thermolithotrophum]ADY72845.1 histidine kinase [Desulfurobacterium thermolithotrophum DSM 11699]
MKINFLRKFFLSDLPIRVSYPLRMGIFYYTTALIFLVASYVIITESIHNSELAKEVFFKLLVAILAVGAVFFIITYMYAKISAEDYKKVEQFAEEISKGNFDYKVELSPIADVDLIRIYQRLEKLRASLILSRELLKRKKTK